MGQWDDCVCMCIYECVCVHAGRDIVVCLCMDLRLCGWAHSEMSQATSRPHKSMFLRGGILMWKWEQSFLLLNMNKRQSPLNSRPENDDSIINAFTITL